MNSVVPTIHSDVLLLVEGEDDQHFVHHLIKKRQLNLSVEIESTVGVYNLLEQLRTEVQPANRKILGIIVDADDNFDSRWKEIVDILSKKGVSTPQKAARSGTIIPPKNGFPKIGIWIMPDNGSKGELEDFVLEMIPKEDEVIPLAKKYIEEIPKKWQEFGKKRTKAELFAWLANARKPGRIGASIDTGKIKVDSSNSNAFVEWLKQLLDQTST